MLGTQRNRTTKSGNNAKAKAAAVDIDVDLDVEDGEVDVDVDVDAVATQQPHFLDYDAVPPPDFEESFDHALSFGIIGGGVLPLAESNGEQLKVDKKYERDGEISDYELAASGYTKKEFTQDDNTLHLSTTATTTAGNAAGGTAAAGFGKPKHFLDENPIPPDYMLLAEEHALREHRSLDRNFERHGALQQHQRSASPTGSARDRSSAGQAHRASRERFKEQSYTLSRFLDSPQQQQLLLLSSSPASLPPRCLAKGGGGAAWIDSFDGSGRRYGSLHLPTTNAASIGGSSGADVLSFSAVIDADTLGPKVECVYSLLSMLGSNDPLEMAKKFVEMSRTAETSATLRRSGCIPLLVQMIHAADDGGGAENSVRRLAGKALHNVVHYHPDERAGRREAKVLRLLDQIMDYCAFLRTLLQSGGEAIADDSDRHPLAAISSLMKVSFDEEHRHAMCELGALQAIPALVQLDHAVHGPRPEDQGCNSLRRYALMALTNLTFGDENNKALLCGQKLFMEALVAQLDAAPDDLLQVTASVLRNLSWRADANMKAVLNEIGTVTALARAAMHNRNENTLKAILSALWNLSAHCSTNKAEFCAVDGALAFLVRMLTYEGPSKTLKIIENAGGILRNVSSHIAVRENYRHILRAHNCLGILLQQLKSESLTVVSNSCGTLWNLSARCPEDQRYLWDNGAVPMLRSLIHSKHTMISEGSASALKNLLNFRPSLHSHSPIDPIARSMGLKQLPTLNARKQKALAQELVGQKEHTETCDNLDVVPEAKDAPNAQATQSSASQQKCRYPLAASLHLTRSAMLTKSESRDSVFSAKSDSIYENLMRSQSASEAGRYKATPNPPDVAASAPEEEDGRGEDDDDEEQPIDYSVKYNEPSASAAAPAVVVDGGVGGSPSVGGNKSAAYATYQETDLDQPTDFSLRYAENQIESDADADVDAARAAKNRQEAGEGGAGGAAILLILEDSVKCYQTEDTPYVISNAASVTDLRQGGGSGGSGKASVTPETAVAEGGEGEKQPEVASSSTTTAPLLPPSLKAAHKRYQRNSSAMAGAGGPPPTGGGGSFTPEKPINYCEEGTPAGYFSRYESLSSLEESPPLQTVPLVETPSRANDTDTQLPAEAEESAPPATNRTAASAVEVVDSCERPVLRQHGIATNSNSAQETPLMFSRHSSMDSLLLAEEDDDGRGDDKSSVVSDFSRLASGVISPSELPDSPTQSMPQSPRRNSAAPLRSGGTAGPGGGVALRVEGTSGGGGGAQLRSVFEDGLNRFHVENTPAQFSCATSLSNLSIIVDDGVASIAANAVPHGEEEEDEEPEDGDDDLLLANCIDMGMKRSTKTARKGGVAAKSGGATEAGAGAPPDEPRHYCTEDTPALLSKVGSNTNLSAISICSSSNANHNHDNNNTNAENKTGANIASNGVPLNMSGDVSSNVSELDDGGSGRVLQQCIRDGMQKAASAAAAAPAQASTAAFVRDPIAMMRRGGNDALPPYLPVSDELIVGGHYQVEDSPCNFSLMSGLSNLTVGSSLVGPAVQLKKHTRANEREEGDAVPPDAQEGREHSAKGRHEQPPQWLDDSLSSLSIDSEDDTNLLSQAIAAGCNRPKSNLGFSSNGVGGAAGKRSTSLSASQPIPVLLTSAASSSSLSAAPVQRHYRQRQRHHQQVAAKHSRNNCGGNHNNNNGGGGGHESYSSVDSSDSNDNQQSKSLLELCIRTGMQKATATSVHQQHNQHQHNSRRQQLLAGAPTGGVGGSRSKSGTAAAPFFTQSNPNLKQFDAPPPPPIQLQHPQQQRVASGGNRHQRERDRDRKDERLLLECINTGITKKIAAGGGILENPIVGRVGLTPRREPPPPQQANNNNTGPKNVLATSAAAPGMCRPFPSANCNSSSNTSNSCTNSTAAPGVENTTTIVSTISTTITANHCSSTNNCISTISNSHRSHSRCTISRAVGAIVTSPETPNELPARTMADGASPPSLEIGRATTTATGFSSRRSSYSLSTAAASLTSRTSTAASDESNESFIMETTVSLAELPPESNGSRADKHKDPDLMLKSVERLTLEFVSSAEQLRSYDPQDAASRRLGSISSGGGGGGGGVVSHSTNHTWNEDTCPNDDVSFPSVSVSAPVVASLNFDDDDDDAERQLHSELALDQGELHDFAENTPTNEAQPPLVEDEEEEQRREREQLLLSLLQGNRNNQTQPNSLGTETETDTLIDETPCASSRLQPTTAGGIQFQLGGAVQSAAGGMFCGHQHQHQHQNHPAMSNSTILACEARALADHIRGLGADNNDDEASLDLDNVRPPSGMESLNMSGHYNYFHDMSPSPSPAHSLQQRHTHTAASQLLVGSALSPKLPRKTLPAGLMARRALGSALPAHLAGSADSMNSSSCQLLLDNIRPPSLMDELLDSMMSVASIQSEVADGDADAPSLATTLSAASLSQYETAAAGGASNDPFDGDGDFDDNTVTLQSCCDPLPRDGDVASAATPLPSDDGDFSSAESSPKKEAGEGTTTGTRRILTPKQKRKLAKDRFKTYTIAADEMPPQLSAAEEHDEVLQIEIIEALPTEEVAGVGGERRERRGRRSSHDRYRTQIIECPVRLLRPASGEATPPLPNCSLSLTSTDDCLSDDGQSSIRAMTTRFKFINAAATATPPYTSEEDGGGGVPLPESDSNNSIECDQNSETESCHAEKMLLLVSDDDDNANDDGADAKASLLQTVGARPRIVVPSQGEDVPQAATIYDTKSAVRGRRKPAYVSPYSMQYQQRNASTATARVLAQQQSNNNSISNNKKVAPVTPKVRPPPPTPLQRQGTFVKNEPTAPVALQHVASPVKRSSQSKLPTKRAASVATTSASAAPTRLSAVVGAKGQATSRLAKKTIRMSAAGGAAAAPQRSNSNATIRVTSSAARIAVLAQRVSATTPPSRSNSNLNGRASAAAAAATATRINQAQSRIAGVWRRVDEAKSKAKQTQPQPKKTTAIGGCGKTKVPPSQTASSAPIGRSKQQQQSEQQPQTLIRSSTFDSTPTVTSATPAAASVSPVAVHK